MKSPPLASLQNAKNSINPANVIGIIINKNTINSNILPPNK